MRARLSGPRGLIVFVSRVWQTTCTAVRGRRRGVRDRLAGVSGRARGAAGAARAGRLPGQRAAGHPRRLGPPARPARVSRRPRSACAESDRRAPGRRAGRGPARAARLRRASTTWTTARRWRWARSRRCRCPADCRSASGARPRARAPPRRRPHRRRHGVLDPVVRRAGLRRLPLAGRDPHGSRRTARSTPTWRRSRGSRRSSSARQHVVPGHGGRCSSATRRWRCSRRTAPTCARCAPPAPTRRCRAGRRTDAQRRIHAQNVGAGHGALSRPAASAALYPTPAWGSRASPPSPSSWAASVLPSPSAPGVMLIAGRRRVAERALTGVPRGARRRDAALVRRGGRKRQ